MGAGYGKFLKSQYLEVHSVQLFPQKDSVGELKLHINKLCTKSTQHKCLKLPVTCVRHQLILKTLVDKSFLTQKIMLLINSKAASDL